MRFVDTVTELSPLDNYRESLDLLIAEGVTRRERFHNTDPIEEYEGPVLADNCDKLPAKLLSPSGAYQPMHW